ncbi:MAG: hpch/hpai aldolase [Gemmatimonadaceae bacterium]|nr:hpch/hpai aldolase [Acetobacteraceae bacterium]
MQATTLKDMCRDGRLHAGHFVVEFATPGIGHILAGAGATFCFLDMEHSGFGFETVKTTLRHLEGAGVAGMVRVPSQAYDHVARALDMGAEGVMVPMLGTGEQAAAFVRHAKYWPDGARGCAFGIAHDRYRPGSPAPKMAAANARTTLFALIETAAGARNADAIAATPGLDCLWVGHFDLSASLGVPGDFGCRAYRDAQEAICAAAQRHGKALGRLVGGMAEAEAAVQDGFTLIAYGGDIWLLQQAVAAGVQGIAALDAARTASGSSRRPAP